MGVGVSKRPRWTCRLGRFREERATSTEPSSLVKAGRTWYTAIQIEDFCATRKTEWCRAVYLSKPLWGPIAFVVKSLIGVGIRIRTAH